MGDGLADERVGNCHGAEILGYDVGQVKEPTTRNRHEPIESRHRRSAEHYSALEQVQHRDELQCGLASELAELCLNDHGRLGWD